jgi:hypothetical protein
MRGAGSVKFPHQERAGFGYAQHARFLQSRLFIGCPVSEHFQEKKLMKTAKIPLTQDFYAHCWCLPVCSVNKHQEFGSNFLKN